MTTVKEISWYRSRFAYLYLMVALVWSLSNILYSLGSYDWPAGDEGWHLSYSKRYYDTGETERATVHNYNSTTPVVLLNVIIAELYKNYSGATEFNKVATRVPQFIWYLVLVLGIGLVGFYLGGGSLSWWAVFLLLLDPNLNAHSALIGTDVPFTAMSVWVLFSILYYLNQPSLYKSALIGVLYGLAFCTKYSATFYVVPIFLAFILAAGRVLFVKGPSSKSFKLSLIVFHSISMVLIVSLIVNCAYSFVGTGEPLSGKIWYSNLFKFLEMKIGAIPMPWPLPFLTGFDQQLAVERGWPWNVILLGQHFPNGVWYYFLLTWLLKTSVGVILLFAYSLCASPSLLLKWRDFKGTWIIIFLTWTSIFCYFSFIFRTQVGLRYAYPCLPLGYLLLAGFVSSRWSVQTQSRVALFVLTLAICDFVPYFGNGISFTNSLLTTKERAYQLIADSNIDWFHNYVGARDDIKKVAKEYQYNPVHILPGNNVFTLNKLAGVMHNFIQYNWVRKNLIPLRHFRHTHLMYYVDNTQFTNFINAERTFSESSNAKIICGQEYEYKNIDEYPHPVLQGSWSSPRVLYSGCLEVQEEALLEVRVKSGWSTVGLYPRENSCIGWPSGAGNSVWFNFKPGMHPVCANVNDTAEYEWILHKGKAKFALRIAK